MSGPHKNFTPMSYLKPSKLIGHNIDRKKLDKYDPVYEKVPTIVVGGFTMNGNTIVWTVGARPDRRHGRTNFNGTISAYSNSLFKEMFSKWKE